MVHRPRRGGLTVIKNPRAAVWLIYLNLVAKGATCGRLQAIKFPEEKFAHHRPTRLPIKQNVGSNKGCHHQRCRGYKGGSQTARVYNSIPFGAVREPPLQFLKNAFYFRSLRHVRIQVQSLRQGFPCLGRVAVFGISHAEVI